MPAQPQGRSVEGDEWHVSRGQSEQHPLELAALFPLAVSHQAQRENAHGGEREDRQVVNLDPVEGGKDRGRRGAGQEPPVEERQVELQGGQGRGRKVEERQDPAQPSRLGPGREDQEEMQREWRKEQSTELVDEIERASGRIREGRLRDQIDRRRGQRPEVKQPRRAASVLEQGVQPDQQIHAADERQRQIAPVEVERRSLIGDLLEGIAPEYDQLALGSTSERGAQAGKIRRRLGPVDQQQSVARDQSRCRIVGPGDLPRADGGRQVEPQRLEGLDFPSHAERGEADDHRRQKEGCCQAGGEGGGASRHAGEILRTVEQVLCHRLTFLNPCQTCFVSKLATFETQKFG